MTIEFRGALFLVIALFSSLLIFYFRPHFLNTSTPHREVLAALPFRFEKSNFKVVKVRDRGKILVEIYEQDSGKSNLNSRFDFDSTKDVFYDFKTSVSNLFVANVDPEPGDEILVPLLGKDLESHVHVIRYSHQEKKFFTDPL